MPDNKTRRLHKKIWHSHDVPWYWVQVKQDIRHQRFYKAGVYSRVNKYD